jgi:MFS transporter, MFS domain-containing protein family, molybdate-anion transporter
MGLLHRIRPRHGLGLAPSSSFVPSTTSSTNNAQGPFLYSLYRTDHAVPSHIIPRLFTTGFLSGALTAPFIGSLADRHGRRTACLVFCLASASSCLLTAFGTSLPLLFLGRVLGGFATSLLFSVFESWMVTDFGNRRLADKGADLSRTFGLMSTVNSVVAIISGVVSEWLVGAAGSAKAPFAASAAIVAVASLFISTQWVGVLDSLGRVWSLIRRV